MKELQGYKIVEYSTHLIATKRYAEKFIAHTSPSQRKIMNFQKLLDIKITNTNPSYKNNCSELTHYILYILCHFVLLAVRNTSNDTK